MGISVYRFNYSWLYSTLEFVTNSPWLEEILYAPPPTPTSVWQQRFEVKKGLEDNPMCFQLDESACKVIFLSVFFSINILDP